MNAIQTSNFITLLYIFVKFRYCCYFCRILY